MTQYARSLELQLSNERLANKELSSQLAVAIRLLQDRQKMSQRFLASVITQFVQFSESISPNGISGFTNNVLLTPNTPVHSRTASGPAGGDITLGAKCSCPHRNKH